MRGKAIAIGVLALALGAAAAPARAQMPEDISPGVYAELEGIEDASGSILASEVELRHASGSSDQVQGTIASVDRARRQITVAGIRVLLPADAQIRGDAGGSVMSASLASGARVDARGRFEDGVLRARSLELRSGSDDREGEVGLEGRISGVDRAKGTFRLLGATVRVTSDTAVELD